MTMSNFADTDSTAVVMCCMQHRQGLKRVVWMSAGKMVQLLLSQSLITTGREHRGAMAVSVCMSPVWPTVHGYCQVFTSLLDMLASDLDSMRNTVLSGDSRTCLALMCGSGVENDCNEALLVLAGRLPIWLFAC
jgi:hypothetical protein